MKCPPSIGGAMALPRQQSHWTCVVVPFPLLLLFASRTSRLIDYFASTFDDNGLYRPPTLMTLAWPSHWTQLLVGDRKQTRDISLDHPFSSAAIAPSPKSIKIQKSQSSVLLPMVGPRQAIGEQTHNGLLFLVEHDNMHLTIVASSRAMAIVPLGGGGDF